ncbi:MAG: bifunctional pyr operon transcriptional regulator/uracil phosphoribosyltransferase PyrR [Thiogranum sp.]
MSKQYDIPALIDQIANELEQKLDLDEQTAMVGIHTGGVWIAQRLHEKLNIQPPLGALDISFYRDDFTRIGMNPQVKPSDLPFTLDDRNIILVDDVLHTGRTIRAAMNELFDYGRPASITLVTLVDRSGRELPIEANVVGVHMELGPGEHVKLSGPDPLALETKSNT